MTETQADEIAELLPYLEPEIRERLRGIAADFARVRPAAPEDAQLAVVRAYVDCAVRVAALSSPR